MFRLARGLSLSPFRRESMLAIMVAPIMILAAVARLGFIADLISKPTMIGYMNGLALTAFRAGTGADWTPAVQPEADPTTADPTART